MLLPGPNPVLIRAWLLILQAHMALFWRALLLVGSCMSAVQTWPEKDSEDVDVMPQPLHITQEGHLMVLTPAGLTQMLNQTRFLLVLFCECSLLGNRV